jgi:ATPase subunit of ABC transporter with duplicated ATPase domains
MLRLAALRLEVERDWGPAQVVAAELALDAFDGTLLLVTHDRRMLDTVRLTRRWHVEAGKVQEIAAD